MRTFDWTKQKLQRDGTVKLLLHQKRVGMKFSERLGRPVGDSEKAVRVCMNCARCMFKNNPNRGKEDGSGDDTDREILTSSSEAEQEARALRAGNSAPFVCRDPPHMPSCALANVLCGRTHGHHDA